MRRRDGDGYNDAACGGNDCDDGDFFVNPGVAEVCDDGVDNNCDGNIDEGCSSCPDADGDGYEDAACGGTDCDDGNFFVNPGAVEICDDGIDNDCNGDIDGDDAACGSSCLPAGCAVLVKRRVLLAPLPPPQVHLQVAHVPNRSTTGALTSPRFSIAAATPEPNVYWCVGIDQR